jgi:hypothetical protein
LKTRIKKMQQEEQLVEKEQIKDIEQSDEEVAIEVQLARKKYRVASYDIHDETYAKQMQKYSLPDAFHKFTEGLMEEPRINRECLLDAIDDYNKTDSCDVFPLPVTFQNAALNFRPYQPCVIC